jgi:5-methylthioadenosine/S-adenosylhomocysteine deaminase
MNKKILAKIKKSLYATAFEDDVQHTRHKANGGQDKKDMLVHNIPFLFTCDETEKLRCFQNYSIAISGGIIQEVIPSKKANPGNYNLVYEAGMRGGIVVTPGLINAHAHPPMYLMRSAMMLDEGESIDETITAMPKWERSMTDEDYTFSAIGDITEQQKAGITTTLSHFAVYWPIELATRATKHNMINAVSVASNSHPENSPELIREIIKEQKDLSESQLAIALHYVHRANAKILKEVKDLQSEHNLLFTCHMAESEKVAKKCLALHGKREVEMLESHGLLTNRTIASHSIYVTDSEIKRLVQNGVGIVHLPTSNVIHKSGTFPLWKFIDAAGNSYIALGTDGVVSKSRLDLLSEAYQTRITHLYSRTVKFGSLFKMMTMNAARTLNMPDRGRILPGMKADLVFWKLKDRGFIPFDEKNPMTLLGNLITHGGRAVRDLMVNGDFVVKSRRHTKINESRLLTILQKKHMAMRRRMARK